MASFLLWCCQGIFLITLMLTVLGIYTYIPLVEEPKDFTGKVVILTGCSERSIGWGFAAKLVEWNATVVCGVRDLQKGEASKKSIATYIKEQRSITTGTFSYEQVDLLEFNSVRKFASKVLGKYKTIDIVIFAAGIVISPIKTTIDGYSPIFQVNYYSQYLLLRLLEDSIVKSNGQVLVVSGSLYVTGSISQRRHSYSLKELQGYGKSYLHLFDATDTALMRNLMAYEFRKRHPTIRSTAFCPGGVDTNILNTERFDIVIKPFRSLLRNSTQGATRGLQFLGSTDQTVPVFIDSYVPMTKYLFKHKFNDADSEWLWNDSENAVGITK